MARTFAPRSRLSVHGSRRHLLLAAVAAALAGGRPDAWAGAARSMREGGLQADVARWTVSSPAEPDSVPGHPRARGWELTGAGRERAFAPVWIHPGEVASLGARQHARDQLELAHAKFEAVDLGRNVVRSMALIADLPSVVLGAVNLLPGTGGQWVEFQVSNPTASAFTLSGLNLNLQVADSGPASEGGFGTVNGPNITDVDLVTGTLFAANNTGTVAGGGASQAGLWTVTTARDTTVTLPAGATVRLARVQFDTTGLPSNGSWALRLGLDIPSQGILAGSEFVGPGAVTFAIQADPGLIVVPELGVTGWLGAATLLGWAGLRRLGRR